MQTVTPPNLNDQHNWGGHAFHPPSVTSPTVDNGLNQATIVAHGRHDTRAQPLSQAGVIASSSDNLFHPVPNIPSLSAFTLPPVPSNPPYHAYNSPDTFQCPLPYRSSLSSYNNPPNTFFTYSGSVGSSPFVSTSYSFLSCFPFFSASI